MAFYGESFALFWGTTLAGSWSDFDDWINHYDDAHHALSSGDDVIVSSYADPSDSAAFAAYLDPLEVRWVLEVLGGSGTVHLSGGLDPDWTFDDPADATQDLGSFSVSGATQIVSPPLTGVTLADLVSVDAAVIVRIECTSGTVDVAQVKLRVWPTAGIQGAWVLYDGDASTTANQVQVYAQLGANGPDPFESADPTVVPVQGRAHVGDSETFEDAPYPDPDADEATLHAAVNARLALAARVGGGAVFGNTFTNSSSAISASHAEAASTLFVWAPDNFFSYLGDSAVSAASGFISAVVDFAIPNVPYPDNPNPNEIADETQAYVRPHGINGDFTRTFAGWVEDTKWHVTFSAADAPQSEWTNEAATLSQVALSGPYEPTGTSSEWSRPTGDYGIITGGTETAIPPGGSVETPNDTIVDVPFADSQHLAITALVPGVTTTATSVLGLREVDWFGNTTHGYSYNVTASVYPTQTIFRVSFGAVDVWDPEASESPRFFVKDLEGDWRPVGFGKPADELAVFRVPTAVGMYRDLTTAEYASHGPDSRPTDGYPLKVKRMDDDGSTWWDQVGWMVPDE